jgi:hypothetical protein
MSDEPHPHTITQQVRDLLERHGAIELTLAFVRAWWPALSIVATAIVVGTVFVVDVKDIKANNEKQLLVNQQYLEQLGELRGELRAMRTELAALGASQQSTANGLQALFDAAHITVSPITVSPAGKPPPARRPAPK